MKNQAFPDWGWRLVQLSRSLWQRDNLWMFKSGLDSERQIDPKNLLFLLDLQIKTKHNKSCDEMWGGWKLSMKIWRDQKFSKMQEENHRVTVKNLLITATVESEGSETENRNLNKPPIHLRDKTETKTSLLTAGLGESYYKCKHKNTNGGEILKKNIYIFSLSAMKSILPKLNNL